MKFNNKRNIAGYFASHFASRSAFLALIVALLIAGQTTSVNASLLDFFGYNNEYEEDYTLENLNGKQQVEYASGDSKSPSNLSEQEVEDGEIASIIEQNRRLLMLPEAKRQILRPATLRTNGSSSNDLNYIAKTSNKNPDANINNVGTSSPKKQLLQNSNLETGVKAKQSLVEATAKNLKEENFGKEKNASEYAKETQNVKVSNVDSKKFAEEKPLANAKKFSYKPNLEKRKQQARPDLGNSSNSDLVNSNQDEELQKNNTDKAVQNVVTKKVAKKTAVATEEDPLLRSADADLARAESKNSLDNSKNKVKAKFPKYMVKKPSLAPTEIAEKSEKPILAKLEPENDSSQQKYVQDIIRDIKNRGKYLKNQRTDSNYKSALPQRSGSGSKEFGIISSLLQGKSQEKNKAPLDGAYVDKSALTYEQDLQRNAELDYSSLNRKIDQFKPRTPTPNRLFNVDISKPDRFNNSNNLVKKTGSFYRAFGEIVLLQGQVTDSFGVPVVNATIEIWQANSAGKYHNLLEPDSEYIDRYFNMSGRAVTDNLGYYNFITIIPGSMANRAPHINMNLKHKNFGTLETEVYFFQHPENKKDSHYLSYSPQDRAMLTAMVEYSQLNNPKSLKVATFNIVIRGSHQYKKY